MGDDNQNLDCHAAMQRLWDYLDHELSAGSMHEVRAHLSACAACYAHYEFERAFLAALRNEQRAGRAPQEVRARVLGALCAEGFVPQYGEC